MTNAPTRELRRHHDVDEPRVDERAFRQGWRLRTRLDQLLADQRISAGEWQAATDFRSAWQSAHEITGRDSAGGLGIGRGHARDAATIARLAAAKKVRIVEAAIGRLASALITACVVEDLSWAAIARHCQRNPETVRDWTVLAIRALSRAWGSTGRPGVRTFLDAGKAGKPHSAFPAPGQGVSLFARRSERRQNIAPIRDSA